QLLPLLGVGRHEIERFLQYQPCFGQLLKLFAALGADVLEVSGNTLTTGVHLLEPDLQRRVARLELTLLPAQPGQSLLQGITLLLMVLNSLAVQSQLFLTFGQPSLLLLQTGLQLLHLLLTGQHPRFLVIARAKAQPIGAYQCPAGVTLDSWLARL